MARSVLRNATLSVLVAAGGLALLEGAVRLGFQPYGHATMPAEIIEQHVGIGDGPVHDDDLGWY
jgi:hypothetical protein